MIRVGDTTTALGALAAHWRRRLRARIAANHRQPRQDHRQGGRRRGARPAARRLPVARQPQQSVGTAAFAARRHRRGGGRRLRAGDVRPGGDPDPDRNRRPRRGAGDHRRRGPPREFPSRFRPSPTPRASSTRPCRRTLARWFNRDDPLVAAQARRFGGRRVEYGFDGEAAIRGSGLRRAASGGFTFRVDAFGARETVRCRLPGRHHAGNVLAGIAVALVLGVPLANAATGVATLEPLPGRGLRTTLPGGAVVVDDTYNSSPRALRAAIREPRRRRPRRRAADAPDPRRRGHARARGERAGAPPRLRATRRPRRSGCGFRRGTARRRDRRRRPRRRRGPRPPFSPTRAPRPRNLATRLRPGDLALFKASRGVALDGALRQLERTPEPEGGA